MNAETRRLSTIALREAESIWHEQGGWFDAGISPSAATAESEQMGIGALRVFKRQ